MNEREHIDTSRIFRKISIGLYLAIIALEISMFFVLDITGLREDTVWTYVRLYVLRPVITNTIIMVLGSSYLRRTTKSDHRKVVNVTMLTLMFANVAYVHSIFVVSLLIFGVPIFMTVVFQDKKLLNFITILSEIFVIFITIESVISGHGVSKVDYFEPSIVIIVIILFTCNRVATMLIDVLNQISDAKFQAMEDAKEARRQAEAANQSKSVFLSNMSHEIRTPINAVLGMDEMIIRESKDPAITDYALDIRSSGKILLALINDVLDFSKIESGRMELVPVDYEISSVINDLVNLISGRVYEKGLSFAVEVSPSVPTVLKGDEIRIKQIVTNILTNAVKYTDRGSITMRVDSSKKDDETIALFFSVKDTGKGMRQEELSRLFTPFARIDEVSNRNIEGTGLGMSITKQLLALMDSELHVESVFGEGSEFSFEILQKVQNWEPLGDYQECFRKSKEHRERYQESFIAPDARILIVDDMKMNLKVVSGLLKQTQIQIDTALSGKECIEKASVQKYDIIFIDHMMPEMDGVETLKQLLANEKGPNHNTPMIALTANAVSGIREYYLKEGFAEYLTKPIDAIKMEKMILYFLPDELVTLRRDDTLPLA